MIIISKLTISSFYFKVYYSLVEKQCNYQWRPIHLNLGWSSYAPNSANQISIETSWTKKKPDQLFIYKYKLEYLNKILLRGLEIEIQKNSIIYWRLWR